jgi:hypothetical protein
MWQNLDVNGADREPAPPGIDTSVAHSARMYDWWLGGRHNFAADRALGEDFSKAIPTIRTMARENRKFLGRVVRYLIREAGIRQFLDIGTGIPTSPNLHEIAQETDPECRVVYVDNDPIVLAHARALIAGPGQNGSGENGSGQADPEHSDPEHSAPAYIHADLRQPAKILTDPALASTLDLTKPVGLMMVAVLMLLSDEDDPWGKTRTLMDALPAGSYLAITHPGQDFNPQAMAGVVAAANRGNMTVVPRSRAKVDRFFHGWELIEPGVVPVMTWWPDDGPPADPNAAYYWAGVARKGPAR